MSFLTKFFESNFLNYFLKYVVVFLENYCYIILNDKLVSLMSFALSTCIFFILLLQSVNGTQYLNFTFLLVLFVAPTTAAVLATAIISLTSIYTSQ